MPTIVYDEFGTEVEFPDSLSKAELNAAAAKVYTQLSGKKSTAKPDEGFETFTPTEEDKRDADIAMAKRRQSIAEKEGKREMLKAELADQGYLAAQAGYNLNPFVGLPNLGAMAYNRLAGEAHPLPFNPADPKSGMYAAQEMLTVSPEARESMTQFAKEKMPYAPPGLAEIVGGTYGASGEFAKMATDPNAAFIGAPAVQKALLGTMAAQAPEAVAEAARSMGAGEPGSEQAQKGIQAAVMLGIPVAAAIKGGRYAGESAGRLEGVERVEQAEPGRTLQEQVASPKKAEAGGKVQEAVVPDLQEHIGADAAARAGSVPDPTPITMPGVGTVGHGLAGNVRAKWANATLPGGEAGFIDLSVLRDFAREVGHKTYEALQAAGQVIQRARSLPVMTPDRRLILEYSMKNQMSFNEAMQAQKELQAITKGDELRGVAMTNYRVAGGDLALLREWAAASKDPKTKAGYEAALTLTPEELQGVADAGATYDAFGHRAMAVGALSHMRDNYVTQMWEGSTRLGSSRILPERLGFALPRKFQTFFEGEQAGWIPKTKDITKILPAYIIEVNRVIAARQMVAQGLKEAASDGRPVFVPRGNAVPVKSATLILPDAVRKVKGSPKMDTSDYKVMPNQPALHDWVYGTTDEAGNPIYLKSDLAVHPEFYKRLKASLGKSHFTSGEMGHVPTVVFRRIDAAQREAKHLMLAGFFTLFHQVQEGTHGVGHKASPFNSIPKIDLVKNVGQRDAAKHGVMLQPDRASADQFIEGFGTSWLVGKVPWLGKRINEYTQYLFHDYIPGMKYKTYEAMVERNGHLYKKDIASGKVTEEQIKLLSAQQANAAYGHLNYADMGRDPTLQMLLQWSAVAPDFLEARFRFVGQAGKTFLGSKAGVEQAAAISRIAFLQGAAAYIIAHAIGAKWDWKDPFVVVYKGRKYTLRSVPEDIMFLVKDSRQFVYSRLNPTIGKTIVQGLSGHNWRGERVPFSETMKEVAQTPVPLSLRPLFGVGNSSISRLEQMMSAMGMRISRYSPQYELAQEIQNWKKKSGDAKLKAEAERSERETHIESSYAGLRRALSDGEMSTAKAEYDKLLATHNPKQIREALNPFKPFSGSRINDRKFLNQASSEQKELFDIARESRKLIYRRFGEMKR